VTSFWSLTLLSQAFEDLRRFPPGAPVTIPLGEALGMVLAADVVSPESLPPFSRSSMDGYAVRCADAGGAGEASPVYLRVVGEVLMGSLPGFFVGPGEAAAIPTGGALPKGADAVVMVEQTSLLSDGTVEILRGAAPGEHIIPAGEDIAAGEKLLPAGRRLRPQDLGALAAVGVTAVGVHPAPRVTIFSTGDELVLPGETPPPGKIRNVNLTIASRALSRLGATVVSLGIVPDDAEAIAATLARALPVSDLVVITGGSSKGVRDHALAIIDAAGPPGVIRHGLAIRPGQPTIVGAAGHVPVIGLPGHPGSSFVVLTVLVGPLVRLLAGERISPDDYAATRGLVPVAATLAADVPSVLGREDFVRVALNRGEDGTLMATPVFGESGLLRTLTAADALLPIPPNLEGHEAGERVLVLLLPGAP
jgi:molybdopterin molybdotransferase